MPRKVTKHRKQDGTGANRPHPGPPLGLILGLVVLSGFAALVYEILWFRQLGLVFGNTVQAAATVLAARAW